MDQPRPRLLLATRRSEALAPLRQQLSSSFELSLVADGAAALERVRVCGPDLVVLDLAVADGSCDLVKVLSACRGENEGVPVLALTGSRPLALAALRSGAGDALFEPFDPEEAGVRAEALVTKRRECELWRAKAHECERLCLTDGLTGLSNRRHFDARVRQEVSRAQRFRDPLSLLLVDLDHFKKVNDTFGHVVGDEVLCCAAAALAASVRSIDVVCRYGGEEFALILPRTPMAGALAVAQRVCFAVAQARTTGRPDVRVTASVGVAAFPDEDILGEQDLLRAADSALYRAKRSGRACVCTWPAPQTFFLSAARPGDARA